MYPGVAENEARSRDSLGSPNLMKIRTRTQAHNNALEERLWHALARGVAPVHLAVAIRVDELVRLALEHDHPQVQLAVIRRVGHAPLAPLRGADMCWWAGVACGGRHVSVDRCRLRHCASRWAHVSECMSMHGYHGGEGVG